MEQLKLRVGQRFIINRGIHHGQTAEIVGVQSGAVVCAIVVPEHLSERFLHIDNVHFDTNGRLT